MLMIKKVMKAVKFAAVAIIRLCDQYDALSKGNKENLPTPTVKTTIFQHSDIKPDSSMTFLPGRTTYCVFDSCRQMLMMQGFLTTEEDRRLKSRLAEWRSSHSGD